VQVLDIFAQNLDFLLVKAGRNDQGFPPVLVV
jgi:hypothetical protein